MCAGAGASAINAIEDHSHLLRQRIRLLHLRSSLRPAGMLQVPDLHLGIQRIRTAIRCTKSFVLVVTDQPSFKLALQGQAAVRTVQQC